MPVIKSFAIELTTLMMLTRWKLWAEIKLKVATGVHQFLIKRLTATDINLTNWHVKLTVIILYVQCVIFIDL